MTRPSAGTKILRVALVQGGKIIEERHVRRLGKVKAIEAKYCGGGRVAKA